MSKGQHPITDHMPAWLRVGNNNNENATEWLYRHKAEIETPERGLLRAVLVDAVETATNKVRRGKQEGQQYRYRLRLQSEARRWIHSKEAGHVFYFVDICGWLHLDPSYIRKRIEARYKKVA